jgi:hypothetical protein
MPATLTEANISLYVGTARTFWVVRVRNTKANITRLAEIASRAHVPPDYGTDPRTGDR